MTDDAVQRDLGRMEAQIAALSGMVATQDVELAKISATLSEAKGGWRVMMLVAGGSASVGALIVKLLPVIGK